MPNLKILKTNNPSLSSNGYIRIQSSGSGFAIVAFGGVKPAVKSPGMLMITSWFGTAGDSTAKNILNNSEVYMKSGDIIIAPSINLDYSDAIILATFGISSASIIERSSVSISSYTKIL